MNDVTLLVRKVISLFTIVTVTVGIGVHCFSCQETDELLSRVRIDEPRLLVEIPDFSHLLSEFSGLSLWTDSRWDYVFQLLEDQENGVLEDGGQFEAIRAAIEGLRIERVVIVVTSTKPLEIELFVQSNHADLEGAANEIYQLGQSMLRKNDNEEDGQETATDSIEKAAADEESRKFVNWQVVRNWIVIASSKNCFERACARLRRSEPVRGSISGSRKNKVLNQVLRPKSKANPEASIYVKFDPKFALDVRGLNDDWYNAIRVDELLGAGFRIGVSNANGEPSIAASGVVLTSFPRVGLGSFVRSADLPRELPEIPKNTDSLTISSFDRKLLWSGYETAYRKVFDGDPGRHLIFGSQYKNRPKVVQDYLQSYAEFQKSIDGCVITGRYRDHESLGTGTYTFSRIERNEQNLDVVSKMLHSIARIEPQNKYVETEINGFPAFINNSDNSFESTLWWNGWVLKGNSKLVEYYAGRGHLAPLNYELEREIKKMQSMFGHSDEILTVKAYWPQYFTSMLSSVVYQSIRERHKDKEADAFNEAMKTEWSKFDLAEPAKPLSKSQAKSFAIALAGQILRDAIGKVVILATDEEDRFQVSATNFHLPANSSKGESEK